jgi:hypothetical protein
MQEDVISAENLCVIRQVDGRTEGKRLLVGAWESGQTTDRRLSNKIQRDQN